MIDSSLWLILRWFFLQFPNILKITWVGSGSAWIRNFCPDPEIRQFRAGSGINHSGSTTLFYSITVFYIWIFIFFIKISAHFNSFYLKHPVPPPHHWKWNGIWLVFPHIKTVLPLYSPCWAPGLSVEYKMPLPPSFYFVEVI